MEAHGCRPRAHVPGRDVLGIRYFLAGGADGAGPHDAACRRGGACSRASATPFRHLSFPDPHDVFTTDDPENAKTVLGTRFEDWVVPRLRRKAFLPVFGNTPSSSPTAPSGTARGPPSGPPLSGTGYPTWTSSTGTSWPRCPATGGPVDLQAEFARLATDTISAFMFGRSTSRPAAVAGAGAGARATRCSSGRKFDAALLQAVATRSRGWAGRRCWSRTGSWTKCSAFLPAAERETTTTTTTPSATISWASSRRGATPPRSVLSYLFYQLSTRPGLVAELRAEIARALPDGAAPVFCPKPGANVRYNPWSMHRRPDLYGPDADDFRPERWRDLRVTWEYIPFNAGPRICIGQQFALTQTQIALVTFRLLQTFRAVERRDDRPPVQKLGISLSMRYGTWVSLTPA
ncbi:cytochrome P450 [Xylariomycetidae sp. FL0641]|nr:cytochrome P450 [Xylariomycetidae sp. FL0641]